MSDASLFTVVVIGVVAFIYVTIIRPAHKDQQKHKQQMRDLRPNDEVLTTSGFIAKVRNIQVQEDGQTHISLEMAEGVIFTAVPSSILQRITPAPQGSGGGADGTLSDQDKQPEQKDLSA